MPLLFDLTASQPNNTIKRHGGGKYCEMLFDGLCKRKASFQAFYDSSKYLNPQVCESLKQYDIKLHDIKDKPLQLIVNQNDIDAIYSALPEALQPWPTCKILGTIHGLRSLELEYDFYGHWLLDSGVVGLNTFLGYFFNKKNKKQTFKHYQKLLRTSNFSFVTDSNHSKKVIQAICPELDIPVFYPPSTSICQSKKTSNEKYILIVSADRFEKNCTRAIIAIDELLSKKRIPSDVLIKITGITRNISRYNIKNISNFRFLGYVDERELDSLYANAYAFIYPSLNEGFGYPPLEAMKYNVPVIASNAASIPEVCGNAALYFSPTSISELEEKIIGLQNKNIYSDLQKKGAARFQEIEARQKEDLDKLVDWIIRNAT
ncbi:MAG: glycosyltransferase [Fibrobacter sp.]|uniref:glycosyltransferase n=1 Tax=Fibrobacter sp. TaxID=35828 RepID=UPI001B0A228F|nr:glycosyltransferase [Fibrobacter sp.]MBO7061534.1 glycosyltransferase [Fibrobacter sp.]